VNRTFHAILFIVATAGGSFAYAYWGNPHIGHELAAVLGLTIGLACGRLVVEGFELARRSRAGRLAVGSVWGGVSGFAFALVTTWGGNETPELPISPWLLFVVGGAIAGGLGNLLVPEKAWRTDWW